MGILPLPRTARDLGIDEEPVVGPDGVRRMRVARVYPGSVAARAGLQPGDVILSCNGYLTEQPGNLAWIIAHAAPDKVLKMKVRRLGAGQEQVITAPFSIDSPDTARPPYLPPVSPGPPPATR
jgi:S1-C subfamily serine protease